ncbi:MAG: AEC family transporter [Chlorobium sp.]|jgi:malate permease and related proteins|nr:AEC family transporter [Chlorobium sp.]
MFDLAFLLAPAFATFFLGMLLRKASVLDDQAADILFKIVYHMALPALLLSVLPYVAISTTMLQLPLISAFLILLTLGAAMLTGKTLNMPEKSYAVLVSGSIIMNLGFVMPFVQSFYGDDGLARLFVFDISNGLSAYTIAYSVACRHGGSIKKGLGPKLMTSPPLLALITALLLNVFGFRPVPIATAVLHSIGGLTIPLILLGLGASFKIAKINPVHLAAAMALRMGLGLALGVWLASLFHLEGLDRAIVILSASAPAGFNTMTFASVEKLDREFAATLVASCMIASLFLIPVLLTIL